MLTPVRVGSRDRRLDLKEFSAAAPSLRGWGVPLDLDAEAAFRHVNRDGSGFLKFAEFAQWAIAAKLLDCIRDAVADVEDALSAGGGCKKGSRLLTRGCGGRREHADAPAALDAGRQELEEEAGRTSRGGGGGRCERGGGEGGRSGRKASRGGGGGCGGAAPFARRGGDRWVEELPGVEA
eukprot:2665272-Rhodomonas_salina.1